MRRPIIIAAAVVIAAAGATAAAAAAGGDDDATDRAITGGALDRAKAAALADTPGRVTETEVGDEESYYEVEVTRPDGSQVDVQLDRDFRVVSSGGDSEDE
ncbi:MAG TPA: PepSY domain-containing protein [Solirubrobacteraceae bacterium]|nr:PepSY domain-containing protein [Solirubrobacteraceae bacterium]